MNFYKFHLKPNTLDHYEHINDTQPDFFWENDLKYLKTKEDKIAKNAEYSVKYAILIKTRFSLGEPVILKSPNDAVVYAKKVLKKPWPDAEKIIATDATASRFYAKDILKGPFPLGEKAIATSDMDSLYYAKSVLKSPFPKGEKAIIESEYSNHYCFEYAKNVLKGPFPKGEKAIAEKSLSSNAYWYAALIKGRFKLGEENIKTSNARLYNSIINGFDTPRNMYNQLMTKLKIDFVL